MECDGICNDDKAAYFKVTCPHNNLPHKVMITKDGNSDKKYKYICQKPQHNATIAYNNDPGYFEVDSDGNLVEFPVKPVTGEEDYIPYEYEILKPFFEIYNITPTWVDCNFTWGLFDEETGHWTGAVGKVNS